MSWLRSLKACSSVGPQDLKVQQPRGPTDLWTAFQFIGACVRMKYAFHFSFYFSPNYNFRRHPSLKAAKYAMVIAGAAHSPVHDSGRTTASSVKGLRARGDYDVTYLISNGANGSEAKRYEKELNYINQIAKPNGTAMVKDIDSQFKTLLEKAKTGDQVELMITAHGGCFDKPGPNCAHFIEVYDEKGNLAAYPSDKLLSYVKALDAKGVKTTWIMESCYSGALDSEVRKLENTCTMLLASPYSTGVGCYTDDPPEAKFHTSTVEYVALRYYKNVMPQLAQGFYKDSACFKNIQKHATEQMLDKKFDTVVDSFWSAFPHDVNSHRPILSSMNQKDYDWMNRLDTYSERPICSQERADGITPLVESTTQYIQNQYQIAMKSYRALLQEQKTLQREKSQKIDDVNFARTANQREVEIYTELDTLTRTILSLERNMYSITRDREVQDNDPCARTL